MLLTNSNLGQDAPTPPLEVFKKSIWTTLKINSVQPQLVPLLSSKLIFTVSCLRALVLSRSHNVLRKIWHVRHATLMTKELNKLFQIHIA